MFREKAQWQSIMLGDILKLKHGYAFKSKFYSNDGHYILLTPGNFKEDGGLQLKGSKEKYFIGEFSEEYLLKRRDLLVVLTDLKQSAPILGASGFIPQNNKYLHNQRLGKVTNWDNSRIDIDYLYYLFNFDGVRGQIKGSATGSTVRHTSPERIYQVQVVIPPLPTQNKIASILSAYDDLIENNTRRIKILETMSQTLYQEWFVKFRFPGHEQAKIVESELGLIPEGWEVTELGELIDIKHGYAFKSKFYSKEPTSQILLTPGNFAIGGGYQDKKLKYYDGDVSEEFILDSGDLLVTMTDLSKLGDTLGYPAFVPASKELTYLHNQRLGKVLIKEDSQIGKQLLYYIFCSDSYRHHVLASATGSTVKHTAPKRIQAFKLALPSIETRNQFESIANSFNSQVACLNQKNDNLRKTRDLLLPKLISGQIDVENLNIDTGELAA